MRELRRLHRLAWYVLVPLMILIVVLAVASRTKTAPAPSSLGRELGR